MAEDSREASTNVTEVVDNKTMSLKKTEQEPQDTIKEPEEPASRKRTREDDSDQDDVIPEDKKAKHEVEVAHEVTQKSTDVVQQKSGESSKDSKDVPREASEQDEESCKETSQHKVEAPEKLNAESSSENPKEKPKFVFGSRTAFGARPQFSMFGATTENKDAETTKEEPTTINAGAAFSGTKSVFGAKSAFGNAFKSALKKESIFKTVESKPTIELDDAEKSEPVTPAPIFQKIHLEKQQVVSGEEDETCVFQVRAKLYYLDLTNVEAGWKEKGVGALKVNVLKTPTETYKARILMRQDAILKLILNLPLAKDIKIFKGLDSSLSREKFLRFQFFESNKPVQYAVKVKNSDDSQALYDKVTELITEK